jgi:hypothetical protein
VSVIGKGRLKAIKCSIVSHPIVFSVNYSVTVQDTGFPRGSELYMVEMRFFLVLVR